MAEETVCLGVIVGARGLKGEVRIKSFTHEPEDVAAYGTLIDQAGDRQFDLRVTGKVKGLVIGRIAGIADRDAAEALKGQELYLPRSALPAPEDETYYHADLIGLVAETAEGEALGSVRAVYDFGAGDVLEIAGGGHGTVMVPFTRNTVPKLDMAAGRLVIDPPDGLLEPPDEEAKEDK